MTASPFLFNQWEVHFFVVLSAKLSTKEVKMLYKMVILGLFLPTAFHKSATYLQLQLGGY
jgi:hypothetical protein